MNKSTDEFLYTLFFLLKGLLIAVGAWFLLTRVLAS